MAVLPVVLAVLLAAVAPALAVPPAEGGRQEQAPAQPPVAQPQPPSASTASPPATDDDLFSIDHIRKELERAPTLTFTMPDPNVPRYRVEIQGKKFQLPPLSERLSIPKSPVQVPFGGTLSADMARLNTPPQYYGSAPFTNGDLLKMSALTGAYGLAGALLKKAIEAHYGASAAEGRARAEVQQELAEVAAHNARVAAGQSDSDGTAAQSADQKKQDQKKKQDEKKKKKKDEGGDR